VLFVAFVVKVKLFIKSSKVNEMGKPRVILRRCDEYDTDLIAGIIRESVFDLKIDISGKIFIKPNVVSANRQYIHHSYTNPKVVEAMVKVLKEKGLTDITAGESGGYGVPSRLFFKESGYFDLAERAGFKLVDLNRNSERIPRPL
jgi:uncharacterized protein (DUF362 family)